MMSTRNIRFAGFLLGLIFPLGATGAGAQRQGGQPRLVLQALDTDHDGALSAAEIQAAPQTLLKLDRNEDGQLTGDELQPRPENAGASVDELVKRMMSFDRNGDGVLTSDEVPARMQGLFERGDANRDGRLTTDEIRLMAERQSMPAGASSKGPEAILRMDSLLNALDTDHDGVISAAEIAAAGKTLLALDRNGDGILTPEEMRIRQQTPQERAEHLLDEWDTNKDGKLTRAEVSDRMQQQFDSIDRNGDGSLDKDELLQYFTLNGANTGAPKEQKQ